MSSVVEGTLNVCSNFTKASSFSWRPPQPNVKISPKSGFVKPTDLQFIRQTVAWFVVCATTQQCFLCNHTAVLSVQPHSSVVVCATTQQRCCLCNHATVLLSVKPHSSVVVCATTQQCCCLCKHTAVHFASLYLLHFPSLSLPHPPHDSPTDLHSTMSLRYSLDRQYSDQLRHCRCLKANSVPWSQECRIHKRYLQRNFGFFLSFSTMSNEGGRHGGGCFYRLTVT